MVTFTVDAVPIAQPRQRHTVRAGFVHNYTPTQHPVNAFKAACQLSCPAIQPFDGPLTVGLLFVLPRPKAMMWKRRPTPRARHAKKPDMDNLIKSVKDALNGKLWRDDSQVQVLTASKWIAAGDEQPHVVIDCDEFGP